MNEHNARNRAGERRLLQACVALGALVPIAGGAAGVLLGPNMVEGNAFIPAIDSHFRYLSGLLFGIGVAFWSTVPSIEVKGARFRLLTALIVAAGLGRLAGLIATGAPSRYLIAWLIMELAITPLLCLWQARIARA